MTIFIIINIIIWTIVFGAIGDIEATYQEQIGEQVIIKTDTLIVVDYSMFNEHYILDNGSTISKAYYDKINKKQ